MDGMDDWKNERLKDFLELLHTHGPHSDEVLQYLEDVRWDEDLYSYCTLSRMLKTMLRWPGQQS